MKTMESLNKGSLLSKLTCYLGPDKLIRARTRLDTSTSLKLDEKRPNAPFLQAFVNTGIKEIVEKYAPLYELKMHSKIEGIEIGF